MTQHPQYGQQPGPQPSLPDPGQPEYRRKPGAPKKPMSREARIGWMVLAGLGVFVFGITIGAGTNPEPTSAAASPAPTVTVSVPGEPGAEVTVTAPPVTVTKPAPPAKTVTAPPPQAAAAITEDGIFLVGSEIKPGQYKSGPSGDCYWARLSNTNGDLDSIIANHNGGNSVVTIKKSDKAFETSGCGEWKKIG